MTRRWAATGPGASCARPRERPVLFVFGVAWRILVPRPGMGPRPTAVKAQSLNHWATGTDLSKVRARAWGLCWRKCSPTVVTGPVLGPGTPGFLKKEEMGVSQAHLHKGDILVFAPLSPLREEEPSSGFSGLQGLA